MVHGVEREEQHDELGRADMSCALLKGLSANTRELERRAGFQRLDNFGTIPVGQHNSGEYEERTTPHLQSVESLV